jgi:hypothetical protein
VTKIFKSEYGQQRRNNVEKKISAGKTAKNKEKQLVRTFSHDIMTDALLKQEEGNSRKRCCFSVLVIPASGPVVVH